MNDQHSAEERLRQAGLPQPAADLRDRVLAAAVPRVRREARANWADRVWFSRRWRLAAVALLFALVSLDEISAVSGLPRAENPGVAAVETQRAADEVARQAGLTPQQARALADRALVAASRPAPGHEMSVAQLIGEQR